MATSNHHTEGSSIKQSLTLQNRRERRRTSRGRNMKFNDNELQELVLASHLVPTGRSTSMTHVEKRYDDFEAASTAVPSSAEQSPELACMESDLRTWPSLPNTEDDWNICEDEMWEDLPEPALPINIEEDNHDVIPATSWWLIPGFGLTENASSTPLGEGETLKTLYADLCRNEEGSQLPPASGAIFPVVRTRDSQRSLWKPTENCQDDALPVPDFELDFKRSRGWKHAHKATWNAKLQRKVDAHKKQRDIQRQQMRCRSRDNEEEEQE